MRSNFIEFDETDILDMDIDTREFKEFCNNIDELDSLCIEQNDFVLEKVVDDASYLRNDIRKSMKNTYQTSRELGSAYARTTDAGAKLAGAGWSMIMKLCRLMSKVFSFVVDKIIKIPMYILKVSDKIASIPPKVINKIKGNIQLYITINDIHELFGNSLMYDLDRFLSAAYSVTKGKCFTSLFHNRGKLKVAKIIFGRNDAKLCRKMKHEYAKIKYLNFEKSTIDMSKKENVYKYFTTDKVVQFTTLAGIKFSGSYVEALQELIKCLEGRKKLFEEYAEMFSDKYNKSMYNDSFANLPGMAQISIQETLTMLSKVGGIIGKFIKYINVDLNTIYKAAEKMSRKGKEIPTMDKNKKEDFSDEPEDEADNE